MFKEVEEVDFMPSIRLEMQALDWVNMESLVRHVAPMVYVSELANRTLSSL